MNYIKPDRYRIKKLVYFFNLSRITIINATITGQQSKIKHPLPNSML